VNPYSSLSLVEVKVQTRAGDQVFFLFCTDKIELQKAMEHNSRLDKEILALQAWVQAPDLERKAFLDLVSSHLPLPGLLRHRGAFAWPTAPGWLWTFRLAPSPASPL